MEKKIKELEDALMHIKENLGKPNVVGNFEKVSYAQFLADYSSEEDDTVKEIYDNVLTLPTRSSTGSAGYDFVLTEDICLKPGETASIVTGIRAKVNDDWVLLLAPRSGLGSNYRLQLNNSIGVIDSDYYDADNEGHIKAVIINDSRDGKVLNLKAGDRFLQGFFVPYGITSDDKAIGERTGGMGSSGLS